jgi:PHD/YefM family antitoxin component YafN of YafNO toxin-antitoxin module
MKLTNKELRQKLNELMDEIISVKEWIFNAIEIEPQLPEMKNKLKELEEELAKIKATENN